MSKYNVNMDGEPLATFMLPENVSNENKQTASGHDLPVSSNANGNADKTGSGRVGKHNVTELKAVCSCDRQRIQYQRSIDFLRSQHQELVGYLHEEVERLKRKNRGLICYRPL